jgi:CRP-like cAMP-binding protein
MSIYAYQLLKVMGLSEPRLLRVLSNVQFQLLEPDHVICRKGSRPDAFSHVLSGLIAAGMPDPDGTLAPLHIAGPGTWIGVNAILNPNEVGLETVCLTPVRLLILPMADAEEAFQNEPRFTQYLAQLMSWRNQLLTEKLVLMRLGSPQLRVVMGLALFAEALHNGSSHLPASEFDECQEIPLKQSLLASMCGVSRGIFSECVQQLAAAGWIRLNYATLALSNVRAWHKFSSNYRSARHYEKLSMPEILRHMTAASESLI